MISVNSPKRIAKQLITRMGYRKVRNEVSVPRDNFIKLIADYERLQFGELGIEIPANSQRPQLLAQLLGTSIPEAYILIRGLAQTRGIAGDVCEFGVAQGATSALIANEIAKGGKLLHLFDSFEGLSTPTQQDRLKDDIMHLGSMAAYAGMMACPDEMVMIRLQTVDFPTSRYQIHKGFIDAVLERANRLPTQVSFAYIDFDFYQPILDALIFLHSVTASGAKIVVDDYDFFSTGAKTAVDQFVAQHDEYVIEIPAQSIAHCAILTRR